MVTCCLTKNEIAHNVMIAKGDNFDEKFTSKTLRVVIWPRKAFVGKFFC